MQEEKAKEYNYLTSIFFFGQQYMCITLPGLQLARLILKTTTSPAKHQRIGKEEVVSTYLFM
jgi:hypothetical protein